MYLFKYICFKFQDGNKVNKSILHEAKLLARTFEEMALRTSSGCKFILHLTDE